MNLARPLGLKCMYFVREEKDKRGKKKKMINVIDEKEKRIQILP